VVFFPSTFAFSSPPNEFLAGYPSVGTDVFSCSFEDLSEKKSFLLLNSQPPIPWCCCCLRETGGLASVINFLSQQKRRHQKLLKVLSSRTALGQTSQQHKAFKNMLQSSMTVARQVGRVGSSTLRRRVDRPLTTATSLLSGQRPTLAAAAEGLVSSSSSSSRRFQQRWMSSYSSFREPLSLFEVNPLGGSGSSDKPTGGIPDRDAPLRADVRTMGSLLGQIIKEHHGDEIFGKIEEFRSLAKKWREAGAGRDSNKAVDASKTFDELAQLCSNLTDEELLIISRAFTHFLAIANSAEAHHRVRLLNETISPLGLPDKPDSCGGALVALLEKGKTAEEIFECISTQQTELVLTAHPTEVNRRVILEKQQRVQKVRRKTSPFRSLLFVSFFLFLAWSFGVSQLCFFSFPTDSDPG